MNCRQEVKPILKKYQSLGWMMLPIYEIAPNGKCSCGDPDCSSPGKHPRGAQGYDHASNHAHTIESWLKAWPTCNWAVACKPSGFVALDIDPRNGGNETFAALVEKHGELPHGPVQNTGGGGQHILVRVDPAIKLKGQLGPGVDVKSRGYILVEPSNHISGGTYQWRVSPCSQ